MSEVTGNCATSNAITFSGYIVNFTLTVTSGTLTIPPGGAVLSSGVTGFVPRTSIPAGTGTTFTLDSRQTIGSIGTPATFTAIPYVGNNSFVFVNNDRQLAANIIYANKKDDLSKSVAGTLAPGVDHNVNLVFKTDYERMQYLMGLYGRTSVGLR